MAIHPLDEFGIHQFSEQLMEARLPRPVFLKWKSAVERLEPLDRPTADSVAAEMKRWAIELGCTHYSHWFQPLTGQTAEKHDSFIERGDDGRPLTSFSGKALIKGDTDGSSFPNGGLRATFEARGYTYWDVSSPAFIREGVLCIPTVFVSFNGEHLDTKGPLLKALDACSKASTRVVNSLGERHVKSVKIVSGLEQEYFLVDREMFLQRQDLLLTGRTLLGASAPRGQEFEDHYFGSIVERVKHYMDDVNASLWKLGIYAKVEHNEVAPGQYEISPIYSEANIAVDQNQILMDVLKKTARQHGMECLIHEKPFKGVNGSGKHNNWSLVTSDGQNLFEPGDDPLTNVRFLLFVAATIKGIDQYAELVRLSASGPGNDHRLGANEAPPAIVSVFLGDTVESVLLKLVEKENGNKSSKSNKTFAPIASLAYVPKDTSDRNRTSPFAFTGNKFELRMMGSSLSPAASDTIIAALLADVLRPIAERLEKCVDTTAAREEALAIIREIMHDHHRIIFSGDGYSKEWVEEAARRGLPNIPSFVESIGSLLDPKAVELFDRTGVYSHDELEARAEILYEQYNKIIRVEALTLIQMVEREILPSLIATLTDLLPFRSLSPHQQRFEDINVHYGIIEQVLAEIEGQLKTCWSIHEAKERGLLMRKTLVPLLEKCRNLVDGIEDKIPLKHYPFPNYTELLFKRD